MFSVEKEVIRQIGINEILKMIPHRYPFLLVDKVDIIEPNEEAVGLKNITMNEPQFTGHFDCRSDGADRRRDRDEQSGRRT